VLILSRRDTIVKARQNVNRSSTKLLFHAGYQVADPAGYFHSFEGHFSPGWGKKRTFEEG